jgi:hypothetical protein
MIEAEAIKRDPINRDENCSFVAGEIRKMRTIMSVLVRVHAVLGDREPILVNSFFATTCRGSAVKRHFVPATQHAG